MSNHEDVIKRVVSKTLHKDISDIDIHLIEDLNIDSLDAISFLFEIEQELDIEIPEEDIDVHELLQLRKLHDYVSKKIKK
jgi:acyl carrier protein